MIFGGERSIAKRREAHEAKTREIEAKHEKRLAEIAAETTRAHAAHQTAVDEAKRAFRERSDELAAELVRDVRAKLWPAVAAYVADPSRANAEGIADAWRPLARRARDEEDDGLVAWPLVAAMCAAKGHAAIAGAETFRLSTRSSVLSALASGIGVAALEQALRDLEAAIDNAAVHPHLRPDPERTAVLVSEVTVRRVSAALSSFDRARQQDARVDRRTPEELAAFQAQQEKNRRTAIAQHTQAVEAEAFASRVNAERDLSASTDRTFLGG